MQFRMAREVLPPDECAEMEACAARIPAINWREIGAYRAVRHRPFGVVNRFPADYTKPLSVDDYSYEFRRMRLERRGPTPYDPPQGQMIALVCGDLIVDYKWIGWTGPLGVLGTKQAAE